jgi:drug/metabolite transporter (DMT)-like permease
VAAPGTGGGGGDVAGGQSRGKIMSGNRIVGIVVAVAGVALLVVGLNSSQAPVDQVTETLTGRFTQGTMVYLIAGIVAIVGGALLALSGRRA